MGKKPVNGALIEVKNNGKTGDGTVLFFEAIGRFEFLTEGIERTAERSWWGKP